MTFLFITISSLVLYVGVRSIFIIFSSCMCRGIFRTKEDTKVADDVVDISGTELSSNSQFADDEYEYESENDQTEVMDSNLIYT